MSNKTTQNDLYVQKEFNQERYDSFNLGKHLVSLMWKEPFYTRILRSITKKETDKIPTAGVTVSNGDFLMIWNRKFLSSLNDLQVNGLIKHEMLHLIYDHVSSRKKDPHLIWNYATDLAINSTIPEQELPKGGLIPGVAFEPLTKEECENLTQDKIDRYYKISKLIESLPKNKTSEYYYDVLINDEDLKQHAEESSSGNGGCCEPIPGIGFDDHEGWGEISEEERELVKAKLEEIMKDAMREGECRGWGTLPSHIIKDLSKMYSKTVNWAELLKIFCGYTRNNERVSSIRKLNRKYPGVHAGIKKNYKPKIAVYIDESGSMGSEELEKIYAELTNLSRTNEFYVYKFDAHVDEESSFLWKKGKRVNLKRNLTGGTCFDAVTDHALKNKSKFNGYIIMTDGCAPKPKSSHGLKRAWITIPNYNIEFKVDRKDFVINMK